MRVALFASVLLIAWAASVAADTIAVADRVCLFLDDRFAEKQSGLERVWHPGRPRPEVAIAAEKENAWETWPHLFGSVIHDPKDGLYKMYYESAIQPRRAGEGRTASFTCYICYAESKDGKTWTKPKLGLFEDLGSKENNITVTDAEFAKVFVDPLETDPAKRLKMFVYLQRPYPWPGGGQGECVLASGDGVKWQLIGSFAKPAYANPEQGNYTDSFTFSFDPVQNLYRAYIRTFAKSHVAEKQDLRRRAIGVTQSTGIIKGWTPIEHALEADVRDDEKVALLSKDSAKQDWAELYCMPFFNYGNHYIGLLSILYFIDGSDLHGGGDLQLTFSHDALAWHRQPERATLIAPSSAAPELFPTYTAINAPLEIGDELWLYYTEANGAHPVSPPRVATSQIRAATWRKDGFVSLRATGRGTLTTPAMTRAGNNLVLNYKAEEGGSVRVGLLDESGQAINQFDPSTCEPLTGDAVGKKVQWVLGSDFSQRVGDKPVRLMFELDKAEVYSFRFVP